MTGNDLEAIKGYAQLGNREIYEQTGISTYQQLELPMLDLGKFGVTMGF